MLLDNNLMFDWQKKKASTMNFLFSVFFVKYGYKFLCKTIKTKQNKKTEARTVSVFFL